MKLRVAPSVGRQFKNNKSVKTKKQKQNCNPWNFMTKKSIYQQIQWLKP